MNTGMLDSTNGINDNRLKIQEVGWKLVIVSAILESWVPKLFLFCYYLPSQTCTQRTFVVIQQSHLLENQFSLHQNEISIFLAINQPPLTVRRLFILLIYTAVLMNARPASHQPCVWPAFLISQWASEWGAFTCSHDIHGDGAESSACVTGFLVQYE